MATVSRIIYVFSLIIISSLFSFSRPDTLSAGSFISPENPNDDVLVSPNGVFTSGFHAIGKNAYCFAVWFSEPVSSDVDRSIVWMENRDDPVNGRGSRLTLQKTGNLVLKDAGSAVVWDTGTFTLTEPKLQLQNSGNMVLLASNGVVLWQSFDSPTDTLLPEQPLTKYTRLVSSRSRTNVSSGFYKLFFDTDNVLRLIFDNNERSSVYWPPTWLLPWEFGRSTYNNTKTAVLDYLGNFSSSDDFTFISADYGSRTQRRLSLDHDGNFRLYTRKGQGESWVVSWQAIANSCKINGICGENSLCRYGRLGRKCTCLPGHKMKNAKDWSVGCEPEYNMSCNKNDSRFIKLTNTEFYGYDFRYSENYSFTACLNLCLQMCDCKGFQYLFYKPYGYFRCYPKTLLVNGYHRSGFFGDVYLRLPKTLGDVSVKEFNLNCPDNVTESLVRTYTRSDANEPVKFLLWFAIGIGGLETVCVLLVWWWLNRFDENSAEVREYFLAATGFKRFSFAELKKATRGFAEEIGTSSSMANLFFFCLLFLAISSSLSFSKSDHHGFAKGKSLSVDKPGNVLASPDGVFSAGFFPVGVNAYCFAVWFNEPSSQQNRTVVWMANRDKPVNGKRSKLRLLKTGNLVLTDADRATIWDTGTYSLSPLQLCLQNSGNIVLVSSEGMVLWQSFDFPTDTILPNQPLARNAKLVSARSLSNFSSGFYNFFFDNDNVLRMTFDNNELSSVYWPSPWLLPLDVGRSTYNNTKTALLDSFGNFSSSDEFSFSSADYGFRFQRMLRLDQDGNLRLYSRLSPGKSWIVSWQAFSNPCKIHGICGANAFCSYSAEFGRKCSCIPGHRMRNHTDWSYGCEPEFSLSCRENESRFLRLLNSEFYGYDSSYNPNFTLADCTKLCLESCSCKAFQYSFSTPEGYFKCYPKTLLVNGQIMPHFPGDIYLRLPINFTFSDDKSSDEFSLNCSSDPPSRIMDRNYEKNQVNESLTFVLWFAAGIGGVELFCFLLVWCLLIRTRKWSNEDRRDYFLVTTGFKRFSFAELKKATRGFSQEIGRGSGGIVYKATLSDSRVAAVKRLSEEACQGGAEFLAEVNTIGKLNHMNLIEMWGYCAEAKHRLLVYEYLEHGSLKENLSTCVLDWKKRFEIAVGTAKGLAYLHEECLEWVLHCDVKPQNILLGSNYQPKVADFGLSKLLKRGEPSDAGFSRIRGTRGYMAPEWVTNRSITSKVDVYSYGIVVLEMLTGKSPATEKTEQIGLVTWVRENAEASFEKVIDPVLDGQYDIEKMRILLGVALRCVEEEKDRRPSMSKVVKSLLDYESFR